MDSEYGRDLFTITDDDGNDYVLEHVDTIEIDNVFYLAFLPTDLGEDDENYGLIILKKTEEDGEQILVSIDDDDDLLEDLFERFIDRILDDEEE
ncbi:MAG: DUF1292 domain-containing protein [Oscillospiraceae bacterium]|nr:DUF1292 domain-containing protein [Oscillospiraceae bacterium]